MAKPDRLSIYDVARQIGEVVLSRWSEHDGIPGRDRNDQLLVAAYGRAYRCFGSIRALAEPPRSEADDAVVLTRTLLSIALRSLYLVAPDDLDEREERFRSATLTEWRSKIRELRALRMAGFEIDVEPERLEENVARLQQIGVSLLPPDAEIAMSLGLRLHYDRVYRLASEWTHYSITAALDGFVEIKIGSPLTVSLEKPEPGRASDALIMAVATYGEFLVRAEPVIGLGVAPSVLAIVSAWNEQGEVPDAARDSAQSDDRDPESRSDQA